MIFLNIYTFSIKMFKPLYYRPYKADPKERCRYCWKSPAWINENPDFHFGALVCTWCLMEGPCTPVFRTRYTYDIGNMTYHINLGAHAKNATCRYCHNDDFEEIFPKKKVVKRKKQEESEKDDEYNPAKKPRKTIVKIVFKPVTPKVVIDILDD